MLQVSDLPRTTGMQPHVAQPPERLIYYTNHRLSQVPQLKSLPPRLVRGIHLAAMVFPFKVNSYVLDNLIDWGAAPDDPMFRLVFPHPDMLQDGDREVLDDLLERGDEVAIAAEVQRIRADMNPHSSDQIVNVPLFEGASLDGVQHKYDETALFFAKQGQTCHSYCSFCFRWPQFVDSAVDRFEARDGERLYAYLRTRRDITDVLLTGGDPFVMSSRRLADYLEPLLAPEFSHVTNIRIGTKALSYWPQRFYVGAEAEELNRLLVRVADSGKQVAVMAHVNHWRELTPEPVHRAVEALRRSGAVIRTQSPVLRHVNDDVAVWRRNWRDQVAMGMIPYYMFVERDTGANHYFRISLDRALAIYQAAAAAVSGICRTARGPVMSAGPGKIHVLGRLAIGNDDYFVLSFLQARRKEWLHRPFLAKYSADAAWINELVPPEGEDGFFFDRPYAELLAQRSGEHRLEAEEVGHE